MDINLTLFGEMLTFAVLVWCTMRYIWPPVMRAMEARRASIAKGLEDAKAGTLLLQKAQTEADELLKKTKASIKALRHQANMQINTLMEQANTEAEAKKAQIIASAQDEIQALVGQARESLISELGDLIQTTTTKVLKSDVCADETTALIASYLKEDE